MVPASVGASQRTETIPKDRQGDVFTGSNPPTAVRIRGLDFEHVMLAGKSKFSFGTEASCDICIESRYRHVSHSHALFERRGDMLRVTDLESKNGIAFQGVKSKQFEIGAGDRFSIDQTVFYVLSDAMRLARPIVGEILGPHRTEDIDDLLMAAVHGGHVFVRAEPGCDQQRLAEQIHHASLQRGKHCVTAQAGGLNEPQFVARARNGTLVLRLDTAGATVGPAFLEALMRPDANVRLILCARSLKEAIDSVTETLAAGAYRVEIPPMRERPGEIASLLERWFIDRQSRLRFSDFTDDNQAALRSYRWPENLEEVRDTADTLIQLAPYASEREAVREVNLARTTTKRWLDKIGLSLPLLQALVA
jgi:hypothetical protein